MSEFDHLWPDFAEIGAAVPGLADASDLHLGVDRLSPDFGEVGPQLANSLIVASLSPASNIIEQSAEARFNMRNSAIVVDPRLKTC